MWMVWETSEGNEEKFLSAGTIAGTVLKRVSQVYPWNILHFQFQQFSLFRYLLAPGEPSHLDTWGS